MAVVPIEIENSLKIVIRQIEIELAFKAEIVNDEDKPLSILNLTKMACMSERSLREWFKKYTGYNIKDYIKKRKTEYTARIFRLFPETSKSEVANLIGLSSSFALYPFMKRGGIKNMDELRIPLSDYDCKILSFREERLPDCIMFYKLDETLYEDCVTAEFENIHWNKIEKFVENYFPQANKKGDIGFAVDRYINGKTEEGFFISGILYENVPVVKLNKIYRKEEIGWRIIPGSRYLVFNYKGDYSGLSPFYNSIFYTLTQHKRRKIDKASLIMEKYLNSPVDTPREELITELWVPVVN